MKTIVLTAVLLAPAAALAQFSSAPGIPVNMLNQPNGPAELDASGRASALPVLPQGLPAPRALGDRARDRLSIRDFLPAPACNGVTDDSPTVFAATTALAGTGRAINVPGDCRLNIGPASRLAGNRIVLDGTGLVGEGGYDSGQGSSYGTRGGTILLTDAGGAAFIARRNWILRNLVFFWPGQTEAAAVANGGTPITMPPLLSSDSAVGLPANEVTAGEFADNDVVNAWDVMDFSADVAGGLRIHDNRAFFLDNFLRLKVMPLESWVRDNDFTPNAYQSAPGVLVGPTFNLRDYAAANASVVQAVGNGTPAASPTTSIDGLHVTNNYEFGLGYGFRVSGGQLNLLDANGNGFDGVQHIMSVETGGRVVGGSSLLGGKWFTYTFGSTAYAAAISVAADSAPNSQLSLVDVQAPSSNGGLVDWQGSNGTLDLLNVRTDGMNAGPSTTAISGIRFASQGGRLTIAASRLVEGGNVPGPCVEIVNPLQYFSITSSQFTSCLAPISVSGAYSSPNQISGNLSIASSGATAYLGTLAGSLNDENNQWDKPGLGWAHNTRGSDGALVFTYKGVVQLAVQPNGFGVRALGGITGNVTP